MTLHPLAVHFSTVADAYERGRREYPPAAVGALAAELAIVPGAPVLDLAAGTGKLTRALLAQGFDVVAVEPLEAFREVLAESVGSERVREGVAEAIPLADGAVAAVTVADAFHWFDQATALAEIRRVLRPGGGLALLSTVPDWSGCSWAPEVGALMQRLRPEHPHFDGPSWKDAVHAGGGFTALREIQVITSQPAQPERMADFLSSMSWVAAMPEAERAGTLAQVTALVEAGETPDELPVRVVIGLTARA
ncbi:MAG TPA: methyltransferase domain-containing protein [Solirubrobacteraceae bacterium]